MALMPDLSAWARVRAAYHRPATARSRIGSGGRTGWMFVSQQCKRSDMGEMFEKDKSRVRDRTEAPRDALDYELGAAPIAK